MLSIETLNFPLLCFFLSLLGFLLRILLDIRFELCNSVFMLAVADYLMQTTLLLRCHNFPLDGLFVIRSPAGRTQSVDIIFDIVEAELANLQQNPRISRRTMPACLYPDILPDNHTDMV